jgi:hypothetical protein
MSLRRCVERGEYRLALGKFRSASRGAWSRDERIVFQLDETHKPIAAVRAYLETPGAKVVGRAVGLLHSRR